MTHASSPMRAETENAAIPMETDTNMTHPHTTNATKRSRRYRRLMLRAVGLALLLAAVAAPSAVAATGDNFGIAAINNPANGAQAVPVLPGASNAFWAGTCDRTAAPLPPPNAGDPPVAIPGGIGGIPPQILAPDSDGPFKQTPVTAPPIPPHCLDWGSTSDFQAAGTDLWSHPAGWRLPAEVQAGGHPDGTATFTFHRPPGSAFTDGAVDNIYVDLPPGFVGDPNAVPKCTAEQFAVQPMACPPESQVGVLHLDITAAGFTGNAHRDFVDERIHPVFNLEPRKGNVAELGFGYASAEDATTVRIVAKARTNGDFGVTTFVGQIPAPLPLRSQQITLWGVPWAASNDRWRAPTGHGAGNSNSGCHLQLGLTSTVRHYIPSSGFTAPGCATSYQPSWGEVKPFISNLTECTGGALSTRLATDSFQNPGAFSSEGDPVLPVPVDNGRPGWKVYESPAPAVQRCGAVPFNADIDLQPTSAAADAASGLSVDLNVAQNDELPFAPPVVGASQPEVDDYVADATAHWKSDAGLATSQLDRAVVTLPDGFSVNPSAAAGLDGCSDAEIGLRQLGSPPLFNNGDPFDGDPSDGAECPQSSIIGEVSVVVPLLEAPLRGHVVLGDPKSTDPVSGEMFRMFIVVKDDERGLLAKIYGSAVADPATGRLTATFDKNPRVPFEDMRIDFKQGDRGILATPQRCATRNFASTFTPWTAAHGGDGEAVSDSGGMGTDQRCGNGFAPVLDAGMDTRAARANGTFSFRFSRQDGEQGLRGLTARLPQGLLASVRDVPLCSNAAANAGSCSAGSRIGTVDAKAGAGDPFVLERKGEVFLTEGYQGGAYGLAVKVRPIAGPFRGGMELSPIVVRQAIHVDRRTAQVTAVSDPFPLIHHGVPLRVREVTVSVNRDRFMLNPSDCTAKQVGADIASDQGTVSNTVNGFQAAGCKNLAFKPKLGLRLTGRKQVRTGKHPGIRATVTQKGIPEAGIEKAEVRLPKSLALDVDNAQALCEFEDGTRPDLEERCPKGSIVGRARAVSPLLNDPLVGNVYFVKNVRRSSSGNLIRTLPMIVVALRGEIAVNLVGESNVKRGKLVNTFDEVPDAPITRFNLNIAGGKNGILAVTRTRKALINLCAKPRGHVAEADIDGQNGKRHDRDIRMKTPCAKRNNNRAANKRKAAKRKAAAKRRANR